MSDPWLRVYQPRPDASRRLFCFPHAGGSAAQYRQWATALPPWIELSIVQYPGRLERLGEPQPAGLVPLAESIVPAVAARLDRPAALFGHSMGATVAFEVARRLPGRIDRLFVSARRAPSISPTAADPAPLDDVALRREIRRLGGTDHVWLDDQELWDLVVPALRNDSRMSRAYRYRPGPPLICPITGIAGESDPSVAVADVAAWRAHTVGGFELHVLAGDHFYYRHSPVPLIELLSSGGAPAPQSTGKVR